MRNTKGLTSRDIEILRLTAEGLRDKEIAKRLDVSPETIKYHWKRIFIKFNGKTRAHIVALAIRRGVI